MTYNITYICSDGKWNRQCTFDDYDDRRKQIEEELREEFKDDDKYSLVSIVASGDIDYQLLDNMRSIREMCELGHKVRANTKIRNRQPIRNAYITFADRAIQNYMLYVDCGKNQFADIIKDELNTINVEFVDETFETKIFNYHMKPNFRSLGPKGYGKQAQAVKTYIQSMGSEDKNNLYRQLKSGNTVSILDVPLTFSDVEIEFVSKENYVSASGKIGAIILDTTLDNHLLNLGFVADFRSIVQNLRKESELNLTDRIFLEVFCKPDKANILQQFSHKLTKDLLATDIQFFPLSNVDFEKVHQFIVHNGTIKTKNEVKDDAIDNEPFCVNLYLEGSSK
jgi:hypothetical protein